MFRFSINSSNSDIFTQNEYETAFKSGGYKTTIVYKSMDVAADVRNRCNRAKNIL